MNQISDVAEAVKNRTAGLLETMEDTGYSYGSATLVVDEYVIQVVISRHERHRTKRGSASGC